MFATFSELNSSSNVSEGKSLKTSKQHHNYVAYSKTQSIHNQDKTYSTS